MRPRWVWSNICGKYQVHSLIFLLCHLITVVTGGNDLEEHSHSYILMVVAGNLLLGLAVTFYPSE